MVRTLVFLAHTIAPRFLTYRSISLPWIFTDSVALTSFYIEHLDIVAVSEFGVNHHFLIPVESRVVIISHEFIESRLERIFSYSPVEPYQFRLVFVNKLVCMHKELTA